MTLQGKGALQGAEVKTLRWEALADQPQGSSREGQSKRRGDEEAGEGTSEGAALPALQTEEGATSQGCSASQRGEGWGTIVPGPPEGARPADTSLLAQGDPLPLWETRCQDWRWELPCPVVGGAATPQKALRPSGRPPRLSSCRVLITRQDTERSVLSGIVAPTLLGRRGQQGSIREYSWPLTPHPSIK